MLKHRIAYWLSAAALICLASAAVTLLLSQSVSTARAADRQPPRTSANPLAPAAIFTDTYDLLSINDIQSAASIVGPFNIIPCTPIIANATFYRGNLSTPATDIDWYRFQLGSQLAYTLTIAAQTPSDLVFAMTLIDPSGNIITTQSGQGPAWSFYNPNLGTYYLQLRAATATVITGTEDKPYQATLCSSVTNITPTPTNTIVPPTATNIPGLNPDLYEPNDTIGEASISYAPTRTTPSFIAVGNSIQNLSFTPYSGRSVDAADWFQFYGRAGSIYQINTSGVQPGVETVLAIYQPDGMTLAIPYSGSNPNNRNTPGQRGSQVVFQANTDGLFWLQIVNADQSPRIPGQTYALSVVEILIATATPGPSPMPGPSATPFPGGADRYEYNGDVEHSTLIAPSVEYKDLNFVPWNPPNLTTVDNDFFRLPVKQGVYYTCETYNLSPGTDTNLIVYNQDRVGIGGNDDADPNGKFNGNFASRFTWMSGYTGYAYVLVGEVTPPLANEGVTRSYALKCSIGLPVTPTPTIDPRGTPTPFPTYAPPVPLPPEPSMTPFPTPRSAQNLPVRPIQPTSGVPTIQPTLPPRLVTLNVQVFNDPNRNSLPDTAEGIANASVRVADEATGLPLAQALTDADGRAIITVENPGPVRLSVPLFGYSAIINDTSVSVRIAVVSAINVPPKLP